MSASTTPTFAPVAARAAARLTVTGLGERDLRGRLAPPELGLQRLPLLLAHHVEFHPDTGDALDRADRRRDVTRDRLTQRAPRHRQVHIDANRSVR
jgi:hypothetical protein